MIDVSSSATLQSVFVLSHESAAQAPIATNPADRLIIVVVMTLESKVRVCTLPVRGYAHTQQNGLWNFGFCKHTCMYTKPLVLHSLGTCISYFVPCALHICVIRTRGEVLKLGGSWLFPRLW